MKLLIETARVLSASKIIDSKLLNVLGVQVIRTVAAKTIHRMRRFPVPNELRDQVKAIRKEGIVVIKDFLSEEQFTDLREECFRLFEAEDVPRVVHDHGAAKLEQVNLLEITGRQDYPQVFSLLEHPRLRDLICIAEKRNVDFLKAHATLERLTQLRAEEEDREADLHVDTFFNTHKGWLYLDDVEIENSPFVYVPGSHRLSLDRLRRTYWESLDPNHRSRRIHSEELEEHGHSEEVYSCPVNTLVVANTCGYHRRYQGTPGRKRIALHFSFRSNPFFPSSLNADQWLSRRNSLVRRFTQ